MSSFSLQGYCLRGTQLLNKDKASQSADIAPKLEHINLSYTAQKHNDIKTFCL